MMRLILAVYVLAAMIAVAHANLPLLGAGKKPAAAGGGCAANGLDFTDGCGTTQYMVILR